ncbi:ROK family transcriptional regulator [Luteimicrobium xylanilyticum]
MLLHGPLARAEIATRLDLSAPSLTRLTKPLLDARLLHEVADAGQRAAGGRPLQPLDIQADVQRFIGIKLAGFRAYGVLTNLRAEIIASDVTEIGDQSPTAVVAKLEELAKKLSHDAADQVAAVGVALGGAVRGFSHVERAPFLHWRDVPLGGLAEATLKLPTVLTNDVDALMEAEHWFGDGRDVQNFATLTIGAGVGGGLVVHDRLVTGPDSGLGLLGHFPLDPLGPACPEGHRGCADALLSTEAIQVQAALALGRPVTYDQVMDLAQAGDPVAEQLVGRSAHAFGLLIAAVANIAQPERIILTGEGIRLAHVGERQLRSALAQARVPEASPLDLRVLEDDPDLWARGAAAVAIQRTVLAHLPDHRAMTVSR